MIMCYSFTFTASKNPVCAEQQKEEVRDSLHNLRRESKGRSDFYLDSP
jgi:hypothetical protein